MAEVAADADVAALSKPDGFTPDSLAKIAVGARQAGNFVLWAVARSPRRARGVPALNGKQLMLLHDAWPELRFEGKPQCHIIPIAKESGEIAVSIGCMLSRVRTGMSNNEVTCAFPASRVPDLIDRLQAARIADNAVAAYAAKDPIRFARQS